MSPAFADSEETNGLIKNAMRIDAIETFICHAYRTNWVFVKVLTDAGLYGVGEATLEMRELTVKKAVNELERNLVGRDPHDIEACWHDTYRDTYWRGGPVLMSALSAVEMALWDIKGKDLDVPVYQLLGGKLREKVPCYANGWFASAKKPEEFAEKAQEAVRLGFGGLKWDPFGDAYRSLTKEELREGLRCVEAVREAVGDKVELLIEGHGRFDVPTAVRVAHALEDYDILWFEEPIPPDDVEGLAEVKQRARVRIAAGERVYSRWDYRSFLHHRCADFVQPDVTHAGGILELRKIAAMAETYSLPVCPHNPSGPVANAATLQLAGCIPNFHVLEMMSSDVSHRRTITDERLQIDDGSVVIPDRPGLGIDIREEEIAHHPYEPRDLRHYTGALTEIRPTDARPYYDESR